MNRYVKRIATAVGLGIVAGLLCAWGASTHGVPGALNVHSAMFWGTVVNRTVLGFLVGIVGVINVHPLFQSVHMRYLRGIGIGTFISLTMAIGTLMQPNMWSTFWLILLAGAIIGLIIDTVVTKAFGDGNHLLDYEEGK